MDINSLNSLSSVASLAKIEVPTSVSAPIFAEPVDSVTVSAGAKEAEKIGKWVEMLKEMPDTFQPVQLVSTQDIQDIIAQKLAQEVGSFLFERP